MSDEETVHQYSKMALQPRRKVIRNLIDGRTVVSRAANQQRVSALERVSDEACRVGLEKKAVLPVWPKIEVSTTLNCAEPIN